MSDRTAAMPWEAPLGAIPDDDETTLFRVWAPHADGVEVELDGRREGLTPSGGGVHEGRLPASAGDDYRYVLDGGDPLPDPCSRFQPEGVRGPSRIVDPGSWSWDEGGWAGLDRRGLVIYELHVGTFTPEGTFAAAAQRLADLRELGVTAVELMPVATFPGDRNWGYDGLYTWAPHPAYGGPEGLQEFVAAAHRAGVGVLIDVVYNHIGPGSETLTAFGPYLTERYGTPWGQAVNFDDRDSGAVREWAVQNSEMWVRDYRVDGLRVDAVHAIYDSGARHIMADLCARARSAGARPVLMVAESDLDDPRVIRPPELGGWGFEAQWADDFHHALHALLTGERDGYYADFGSVEDLAEATRAAFVRPGAYSEHRGRRHGAPANDRHPRQFVVCSQNHDQVGNRALGDRPPEHTRRLAAMWTLLSPFVPMLFMGEEHGEEHPFQFFTDHIDPFIATATRDGRRREFAAFTGFSGEEVPDPQDAATAARSVIDPGAGDPAMRELYRSLIALRRELPEGRPAVGYRPGHPWITVHRGALTIIGNFGDDEVEVPVRDAERLVLETDAGVALTGGLVRLPRWSGAVAR